MVDTYDPGSTCFVIAPIGEKDTEIRRRSDLMFQFIIAEAADACGLTAIRADQLDSSGLITHQIIEHIANDRVVVADLAGRNPNVYYELALRHALRLPYVQLIGTDEDVPFDVKDVRTISVDLRDLASTSKCKQQLRRYIEGAISGNEEIRTPISVALELMDMRRSGDAEQMAMADLHAQLTEMREGLGGLRDMLKKWANLQNHTAEWVKYIGTTMNSMKQMLGGLPQAEAQHQEMMTELRRIGACLGAYGEAEDDEQAFLDYYDAYEQYDDQLDPEYPHAEADETEPSSEGDPFGEQ